MIHLVWILGKAEMSWAWGNFIASLSNHLTSTYIQTVMTLHEVFTDMSVKNLLDEANLVYVFHPSVARWLIQTYKMDPCKIIVRLSGWRPFTDAM